MTPQALWTTVDCACAKPAGLAPARSTPLQEINLLYLAELVDALDHAVELLAARVDGLEYRLGACWNVIEAPLSPGEAIERLRQLRDELL